MATHRDALDVPSSWVSAAASTFWPAMVNARRQPWQRHGFEWLYRIVQEPRRMWWRYLSTNAVYAGILTLRRARQGDPVQARLIGTNMVVLVQ